jgi:hypothetical protein
VLGRLARTLVEDLVDLDGRADVDGRPHRVRVGVINPANTFPGSYTVTTRALYPAKIGAVSRIARSADGEPS